MGETRAGRRNLRLESLIFGSLRVKPSGSMPDRLMAEQLFGLLTRW